MNVRAIALGALVGFVVAFAPACSPPKCGPQNCDGCCDAKNACVKKPNNNNNTTCGSAGNTCTDCAAAGSTCNPSTSTCGTVGGGGGGGSTGGGTGTGGGGVACDGCQLPSGACSPSQLSATSTSNCGLNNVRCVACAMGELCTAGVCGVPDSGVASVGSACNTNADCSTIVLTARDSQLGVKAFCKKAATDVTAANGQGVAYTGGYCTKRCAFEETPAPGSCGTGNTCSFLLGDIGEADNVCFHNCQTDAECRPEYFCLGYSQTTGICLPRTLLKDLPDGGQSISQLDAGPGRPGEAGAPCAMDTACQPPNNGVCIEESLDAGFFGGACTSECTATWSDDTWCGTGGVCSPAFAGRDSLNAPVVRWFCERGCGPLSDGGIVGMCRDGYACEGTNQFATCVPKCTSVGVTCGTGQTCNMTTGLCQ